MTVTILQGDCIEVLRTLPDASVHSCVTDPPYELGFMGKGWDKSGIANTPAMWREVLRVLKPGGHLLAFSGTRTYHRMTCAIEDAGFEIRDQIGWAYGQGFPKSHNLDGDWQGWGTALKPAWEPICVARKPLAEKTVAANVLANGTGALNIDASRVGTERREYKGGMGRFNEQAQAHGFRPYTNGVPSHSEETFVAEGRWPANLIHDGSDEVLALFPEAPGQLGPISTTAPSEKTSNVYGRMKREGEASAESDNDGAVGFKMKPGARRLDEGSAARFFARCEDGDEEWLLRAGLANVAGDYLSLQNHNVVSALNAAAMSALPEGRQSSVVSAPSTIVTPSELRTLCDSVIEAIKITERACWRGALPEKPILLREPVRFAVRRAQTDTMTITLSHWRSDGSADPVTFDITPRNMDHGGAVSPGRLHYCAKASKADRGEGNTHPTVKPVALMRYLIRLVTPPGGTLLDPFGGSGTTGVAAQAEGFNATLIELNPEYVEIARKRLAEDAPKTAETPLKPRAAQDDLGPLFAGGAA